MQSIGLFLLVLVGFALVAGLYLSVTAQAAAVGVHIQELEATREVLVRQISNQRYELAILNSSSNMDQRGEKLGLVSTDPDNALYVVVPGYRGRQTARLGVTPGPVTEHHAVIRPAYTESLWEWLFRSMVQLSQQEGAQGGSDLGPKFKGEEKLQ